MVATAADAQNVSFGCGDDYEFTYFDRAYFDQELRRSFSFVDAFAKSQESILERETREGLTHSNPQLFVGDAIRPKLDRLRQRFEQNAVAAPSAGSSQRSAETESENGQTVPPIAAQSAKSVGTEDTSLNNWLSAVVSWVPFLALIAFWVYFLKKMKTSRQAALVERSFQHMERVETLLEGIAARLDHENRR